VPGAFEIPLTAPAAGPDRHVRRDHRRGVCRRWRYLPA
jgi:hypothetical protein